MPANWLKQECWLEDPQPPRPRGPKPDRTVKPKPPKGKMQEPTPAAERVANRQKPVAKSANPVVEKPALAKRVASQTDKAHASPRPHGELSPPSPKPLASAEAPKPAISCRITLDATELGLLRGLAIRPDAPKPISPAVGPSLTATNASEPPKPQSGMTCGEAIAAEQPKPAPPPPASKRVQPRVWHEKYGFGRAVRSEGNGVLVILDDYTEVLFCDPASLNLVSVFHPEHGHGFVLGVGGAEYNPWDNRALANKELAEPADGELIVDFGSRGTRRVSAAEVSTTNLASLLRPKPAPAKATAPNPAIASTSGQVARSFTLDAIADEASKLSVKDTLLQCAEGRMEIPVDTVFAMQTLFGLKRKEDMQNEGLAKMLGSAGLDAEGAAAIKKQIWSVLEMLESFS